MEIYPAYRANIHERRIAAMAVRSIPLIFLITVAGASVYTMLHYPKVLVSMCAVLNTHLWLCLVSAGICSIFGALKAQRQIAEAHPVEASCATSNKLEDEASQPLIEEPDPETAHPEPAVDEGPDQVKHLIVIPNFREDEDMLGQTLRSLSEAEGSSDFRVVVAMEERENWEGTMKGQRLKYMYEHHFRWLLVTHHPATLVEYHQDGSMDDEVPGKASNVKWSVVEARKRCMEEASLDMNMVVLTVADADCLFHPGYFNAISRDFMSTEFSAARMDPQAHPMHVMWQAPQLPFRDLWHTPVPSRLVGYMTSMNEFSGVSSLRYGGLHMVFSGYSMTMRLALEASPWDGDVIAEDHHCFLKCFFYSVHAAAVRGECWQSSMFQVRPILLPAKSTSVISSKGYWYSWIEKFSQAKRHTHGVSELAYCLLAGWDTLCTMPMKFLSLSFVIHLSRLVFRFWVIHLLPILQTVALGVLSTWWFLHNGSVPTCPTAMRLTAENYHEVLRCGLGGAYMLGWPVIVFLLFLITTNYLFVLVAFVQPAHIVAKDSQLRSTIWYSEDGGCPQSCSAALAMFVLISVDCIIANFFLVIPYGFLPLILAYLNVFFFGNRVPYVTAAKNIYKRRAAETMLKGCTIRRGHSKYGSVGDMHENGQKSVSFT